MWAECKQNDKQREGLPGEESPGKETQVSPDLHISAQAHLAPGFGGSSQHLSLLGAVLLQSLLSITELR